MKDWSDIVKVKVEHIFHSGFSVETDNYYLIFDYYKGRVNLKDKKTLVFVSHGHQDHYNEEVFHWQNPNRQIDYIVSSDIRLVNEDKNIHILEPYEALTLEGVKIRTYGSTDLGLSFLVNVDGLSIFHSGDLNWWHWESNSQDENLQEERIFKEELTRIGSQKIDLAFVPVDPRLGDAYNLAGKYFIDIFQPTYFFPMHFADNFSICKDFIHDLGQTSSKVFQIDNENQVFQLQI